MLLVVLRVFSLVLAIQVSGGFAAAAEIVGMLAPDGCSHDAPCSSDEPCDDCPPGCPSCACASGLRTVVPELGWSVSAPVVALLVEVPRPGRAGPIGPEPSPPYRPPRAPSA
jgi:hypothetical protein